MTDTTTDRARCRELTTSDVLVWTGNARRSCDTVKIIARRKGTDDGWWMTDGSGLADSVWDNGTAWVTLTDLLAAREALARVEALCDEYAPLPAGHGMVPGSTLRRAITGETP